MCSVSPSLKYTPTIRRWGMVWNSGTRPKNAHCYAVVSLVRFSHHFSLSPGAILVNVIFVFRMTNQTEEEQTARMSSSVRKHRHRGGKFIFFKYYIILYYSLLYYIISYIELFTVALTNFIRLSFIVIVCMLFLYIIWLLYGLFERKWLEQRSIVCLKMQKFCIWSIFI